MVNITCAPPLPSPSQTHLPAKAVWCVLHTQKIPESSTGFSHPSWRATTNCFIFSPLSFFRRSGRSGRQIPPPSPQITRLFMGCTGCITRYTCVVHMCQLFRLWGFACLLYRHTLAAGQWTTLYADNAAHTTYSLEQIVHRLLFDVSKLPL